MKKYFARGLRFGACALSMALAAGCTLIEDRDPEPLRIPGAGMSEIPFPLHLGAWGNQPLVANTFGNGFGLFRLDPNVDTIVVSYDLKGQYPTQTTTISGNVLVSAVAGAGVYFYDLPTGAYASSQPLQNANQHVLMGSLDRLFLQEGSHGKFVEILDGPAVSESFGDVGSVHGVATGAGRIFLASGPIGRILYRSDAGGAFDTLDVFAPLHDSDVVVRDLVVHDGRLFVHISPRGVFTAEDTSYVAVFNASTLALEKTIGLHYRHFNDEHRPTRPRVEDGKWYLGGRMDINGYSAMEGFEVVDLDARTHAGLVNFQPAGITRILDFVITEPGKGYVIDATRFRVRKVTF